MASVVYKYKTSCEKKMTLMKITKWKLQKSAQI